MKTEKNQTTHTKDSVYADIHQKIREGQLAPGDWFVERELCEQYGLSRTPMREVLWNLEKDGLLIQTPGRGFRIRKLNLQEIMEIFQAREAVEGMAAYLVSHLSDEAFFEKLKDIRDRLEALDENDLQEEGPKVGAQMHKHIISHARNSILQSYFEKLHLLYSLTVNITRRSQDIEKISRESHLSIMDAIIARDGEKAEKLMREHLRETCRNITKIFYPNLLD